jgi:hypothetical protein
MARRKNSKLESAFISLAVVIGGIGWIIGKVLDTVGAVFPIVVIGLIIAGVVWFKHSQKQKRIEHLLDKYGDEAVVDRIMRRIPWQGETAQQLIDSLGNPLNVDRKLMATRKREVWKYQQTGRGRYALRLTLDNDVVIEIDQKTS